MTPSHCLIALIIFVSALAGCVGKTTVNSYDFRDRSGLYVLAYTPDEQLRMAMEDQLLADLESRDMPGFVSHEDLPELATITRESLLSAANGRSAAGLLLITQVAPGENGIETGRQRITPAHPDVKAFFDYTRGLRAESTQDGAVFAEVTGFLLHDQGARQFWSGTTWSFDVDGEGTAITGISGTIADEIARLRDAMRTRAGY